MNILKKGMSSPFGCLESIIILVVPPIVSVAVTLSSMRPTSSLVVGLIIFPVAYLLSLFITFLGMAYIAGKKGEQKIELQQKEKENKELGLHQYMFSVKDFWPSKSILLHDICGFISVDENRLKVLLGGATQENTGILTKLIDINDIISFELFEIVQGSKEKQMPDMIGSVARGGLLLGAAGDIISAKAGSKTSAKSQTVLVLGIKFMLDSIETPIISINFLSHEIARTSQEYKQTLFIIEEWLAVLKILKDRSCKQIC